MTVTDRGGWRDQDPVYWVAAFEPRSYLDAPQGGPITYAFKESGESPRGEPARPLTAAEKANIQEAIEVVGQGVGLTFVETSEPDPHILFAAGPSAAGEAAGRAFNRVNAPEQVWAYDDGYDSPDGLAENTYIYKHELLHGLGLRHSSEIYGATGPVVIPAAESEGTTLFGEWWPYWQNDIQVFDLAALQYLHGPDPEARAGDDTYTLIPAAFDPNGPRSQWPLLWDGGGFDTLDYTDNTGGITVSLAPGSVNRLGASLDAGILDAGTFSINYNTWIEALNGGDGEDTLSGSKGDNWLKGNAGDDRLAGDLGSDTAVYAGPRDAYEVSEQAGGIQVRDKTGAEGTDTLSGIEVIAFADGDVAIADLFLDGGPEAGPTPVDFAQPPEVFSIERGTEADDVLAPSGSALNTGFDAKGGRDTVAYALSSDAARFEIEDDYVLIQTPDTLDQLVSVERVQFTDGTLAFDTDGNAGAAYRVYQAAFDRTPDIAGLGFWVRQLDNDATTPIDMAGGFINSAEFRQAYGEDVSDAELVTLLYRNVLDRDPDEAGLTFWRETLEDGSYTPPGVLAAFAESPENRANTAGEIADGIWFV